jgi:hypothetical protein
MKSSSSRNVIILSVSMIMSSALIAGGVAYASGEAITACVKKSNGATRIISGKMKCTKWERSVTWGSTGDQGPSGAQGATGSNGVSNVYKKELGVLDIAYNAALTVMSATVPAGKYNFQFSGELGYFNNNTATLKTRYMPCLITKRSDAATSFSLANAGEVLWPIVGSNSPFRTSFPATGAAVDEVGKQTYSFSGTLDLASDTPIYLQCTNENLSGDTPSAGQLSKFAYRKLILVKTDAVTTLN